MVFAPLRGASALVVGGAKVVKLTSCARIAVLYMGSARMAFVFVPWAILLQIAPYAVLHQLSKIVNQPKLPTPAVAVAATIVLKTATAMACVGVLAYVSVCRDEVGQVVGIAPLVPMVALDMDFATMVVASVLLEVLARIVQGCL